MRSSVTSEKGMALIIVLLITVFLVTVITEIVYAVHRYGEMASLYTNGERASLLASGGVLLTGSLLYEKLIDENEVTVLYESETDRIIKNSDGEVRITLADEQGKVSLNAILTSKGIVHEDKLDVFSRLVDTLELPRELSDTLADWLDKDNDHRKTVGAETSNYYGTLKRPYRAKNSTLDSVDELLLIKGFTPKVVKALKPYVTIHTDGLININTAPVEVIMALDKQITQDMAETVISEREKSPIKSVTELRDIPGFSIVAVGLRKKVSVKSSKFGLTSRANVGGSVRVVEAVILQSSGVEPTVLYWREF